MKAKKSYKKGGKMEQRSKNPKSSSSAKMNLSNWSAQSALDKVRSEREEERRNTKAAPRAMKEKFDNGGKVKRTANVNTRGEGKKKEKPLNMLVDTRIADGPGRSEYIKQEKAAQGPLKKLKSKGPNVIGLAQKVKPGTIKKRKAVIPVPPAKGRRRKNRK